MCVPLQPLALDRWQQQILDAVTEPDPIQSNRKITACHYDLSRALRQALGTEAGANFHTWAVWGSHKAGATIRQEDLAAAAHRGRPVISAAGSMLGLATALLLLVQPSLLTVLSVALVGALVAALLWQLVIARGRRTAPAQILAGNRIVLEDIGTLTARFLACLHGPRHLADARVQEFLATLRPGPTAGGGQDLLRAAFGHYQQARRASDPREKQRATYLANCLAILHEHIRLQPHIAAAIPRLLRRGVTRWLLHFEVGPLRLWVSQGIAAPAAAHLRQELCALKIPEVLEYLSDGHPGQAAADWTRLRERMRYVLGLFHVLHASPAVFASPLSLSR